MDANVPTNAQTGGIAAFDAGYTLLPIVFVSLAILVSVLWIGFLGWVAGRFVGLW
jgi:hypothetical protein